MKRSLYAIPLALALLTASTSFAKFGLGLRPTLGLNFNMYTGMPGTLSWNGFGASIGCEAAMTFSPKIGLHSKWTFYDSKYASASQSYTDEQGNSGTVTGGFSVGYMQFENMLALRLGSGGLYLQGGPVFGFVLHSSYTETTSAGASGSRTLTGANVNLALKLGAGMDIPIGTEIYLTPDISASYGLITTTSGGDARIFTIQTNAGVKFILI